MLAHSCASLQSLGCVFKAAVPVLPSPHCRAEADAALRQRDELQTRIRQLQEQLLERQVGWWVPATQDSTILQDISSSQLVNLTQPVMDRCWRVAAGPSGQAAAGSQGGVWGSRLQQHFLQQHCKCSASCMEGSAPRAAAAMLAAFIVLYVMTMLLHM